MTLEKKVAVNACDFFNLDPVVDAGSVDYLIKTNAPLTVVVLDDRAVCAGSIDFETVVNFLRVSTR